MDHHSCFLPPSPLFTKLSRVDACCASFNSFPQLFSIAFFLSGQLHISFNVFVSLKPLAYFLALAKISHPILAIFIHPITLYASWGTGEKKLMKKKEMREEDFSPEKYLKSVLQAWIRTCTLLRSRKEKRKDLGMLRKLHPVSLCSLLRNQYLELQSTKCCFLSWREL